MTYITSSLLGLLLAIPVAPQIIANQTPLPVATPIAVESWEPKIGDRILVDTKLNVGYLAHFDGEYIQFPLVTGQNRWVSYIGRYYKASTPNRKWEAKSMHIKGDRVTFGPSGRFLRLYWNGERTAYGVHEHRDEKKMFAENAENRFRSMGCIIVESVVMDLLEETFSVNRETVTVSTTFGIADIQEALLAL